MIDKIRDYLDDLEYLNFLLEEENCIMNEEKIYLGKKKIENSLKRSLEVNKLCGKYFKLFAIGYTREQIAKKLKVSIKLVEKYFDKWAF